MENVCPVCGITYKEFRTGMTFAEVKAEMYVSSEDSDDWVYKRRRCVLRRWRKIKIVLWEYHLKECYLKDVSEESSIEDFVEY